MSDWKSKLKDAKELLDMGAITQEDFDSLKNDLLAQLRGDTPSKGDSTSPSKKVGKTSSRLVMTKGLCESDEGWTFISSEEVVCGRAFGKDTDHVDIKLTAGVIVDWTVEDGVPKDPNLKRSFQISGRHCVFELTNNAFFLRELGASNGTFLDGQRLEKGGKASLEDKHIIGIGDVVSMTVQSLKSDGQVNGLHIFCNEVHPERHTVILNDGVGLFPTAETLVDSSQSNASINLSVDETGQFFLKNCTVQNCSVDGYALAEGEAYPLNGQVVLLECEGEMWLIDLEHAVQGSNTVQQSKPASSNQQRSIPVAPKEKPISEAPPTVSTSQTTQDRQIEFERLEVERQRLVSQAKLTTEQPKSAGKWGFMPLFILIVVAVAVLMSGEDDSNIKEGSVSQPVQTVGEPIQTQKPTEQKEETVSEQADTVGAAVTAEGSATPSTTADGTVTLQVEGKEKAPENTEGNPQVSAKGNSAQELDGVNKSTEGSPVQAVQGDNETTEPTENVEKSEPSATEVTQSQVLACTNFTALKPVALKGGLDAGAKVCLENVIATSESTSEKRAAALLLILNVDSSETTKTEQVTQYQSLFDGQFDVAYKEFKETAP